MSTEEWGVVQDVFCFNGVDGVTGSYLLPPTAPKIVYRGVRRFSRPLELDELHYRRELATEKVFGPGEGRDPCDLAQVGWGVVFAHGCDRDRLTSPESAGGGARW